jgi:competence protein ComGC
MLADDSSPGEVEGFTFVEIVIGLLVAGIIAAIVVFAVTTVTNPVLKPDPACTREAANVQDAISKYLLTHNVTYPKTLGDLVKAKLLAVAPTKASPTGAAGFTYNNQTGEYIGTCPKH